MPVKKAIIMSGGTGSRLYPLTAQVNKHLLPVYDKPMIYYPLSVLMLSGIREFLIIVNSNDLASYEGLLGDGSHLGLTITYQMQNNPGGIAEGLIIGSKFINGEPIALILGDNIFHGSELITKVKNALLLESGAHIFLQKVDNPSAFGVAELDEYKNIVTIHEKPEKPQSDLAVTGLYVYDGSISDKIQEMEYSDRGELEITDLNNLYAESKQLNYTTLGRGIAWLDAGTKDNLMEAALYVKSIESRQGYKVCCPEEIAIRQNWVTKISVLRHIEKYENSKYYDYLYKLDVN